MERKRKEEEGRRKKKQEKGEEAEVNDVDEEGMKVENGWLITMHDS